MLDWSMMTMRYPWAVTPKFSSLMRMSSITRHQNRDDNTPQAASRHPNGIDMTTHIRRHFTNFYLIHSCTDLIHQVVVLSIPLLLVTLSMELKYALSMVHSMSITAHRKSLFCFSKPLQ